MSRVITPGIFYYFKFKNYDRIVKDEVLCIIGRRIITKESLEEELGKFVEEVAGLCDTGEDYLSTCRALNYTKTRLQALLEMYKDCDGVGEERGVSVMLYRARIASG